MKPLPLLIALALGAIIGYLVGRPPSGEDERHDRMENRELLVMPPALQGMTESADSPRPGTSAVPPASNASPGTATPSPAAARPPAAVDGISNPIDAGPVFNQQFATAEKQGVSDGMVEAHRALEREARDDSWSYPLEAEIENSLIPDTSMGNFRKEHLECRSTMCEIRLSAQGGAQIEALRQWTSDIQKFPWAQQMQLSSSSTVSSDDRMDALLIVSKPPEMPEGN